MNVDKFKRQHTEIMEAIAELRSLIKAGIGKYAPQIAEQITSMSTIINLHLLIEDKVLYPILKKSENPVYRELGRRYQSEMDGLAGAYTKFAEKWSSPGEIAEDIDGFKSEANLVFKALHDRIEKENAELYPALELIQPVSRYETM